MLVKHKIVFLLGNVIWIIIAADLNHNLQAEYGD
jgi:hypothetical protein